MTAEELLLDETYTWLEKARGDLQNAAVLIAAERYAGALFFCQQAAEKAMKAFLTYHQTPFRKTHELDELFPDILAIDRSLQPILDQAGKLSEYAWKFRYPGASYEPEAAEGAEGMRRAELTVHEIEQRLPPAP